MIAGYQITKSKWNSAGYCSATIQTKSIRPGARCRCNGNRSIIYAGTGSIGFCRSGSNIAGKVYCDINRAGTSTGKIGYNNCMRTRCYSIKSLWTGPCYRSSSKTKVYGGVPTPAGTLTVIVPSGGPQVASVLVAVAPRLLRRSTVMVSKLMS